MTDDALPVRNGVLWFALLGGPVAWTIHLLASYPLVPLACRLQTTLPLNLITAGTAALAAAAALTGALAWKRVRGVASREGREAPHRARFMAIVGAVLGTFFVYVILVEGLPPILQDPCVEGL